MIDLAFVFLCLIALALFLAPALDSGDTADLGRRVMHLVVLPIWAAAAWVLHKNLHRICPQRDPLLLPIALLLTGWGQLEIWRIAPAFGLRQVGWLIIAVSAALVILRNGKDLAWLRNYRYLWLSAGLLLTLLTLIFGTNPSVNEPRLWLGCCGVYFQPSEPLRLLLIAFMASYLADRVVTMRLGDRNSWAGLLAPLILAWGLSAALLLAQRDLGTGSLFLALFTVLLYMSSGRWQVLLAAAFLGALAVWLGHSLFDIVQIRVEAWIHPWLDPAGGSYQIVQALIAVASGGLFGSGPGLGSPGYVPVAHSDLIFAAVAEEYGIAGSLGMIGLYAVLVARGLRASRRRTDPFYAILSAGLAVAFGLQAVFILGGALRFLPLAGITLPFVSYGGSSLLTSFSGLALLLLVSAEGEGRGSGFSLATRHVQFGFSLLWTALALLLAWWGLVRAPDLRARPDNPRTRTPQPSIVASENALTSSSSSLSGTESQDGTSLRVPNPLTDHSFTATMHRRA